MTANLEHLITAAFPEHLDAFERHVLRRVLPAFDSVEEEADRVAKQVIEEESFAAADLDEDDDSIAERALDAANEYRDTVESMRQATHNLLAVGLFHIYEQQSGVLRMLGLDVEDQNSPLVSTEAYQKVQELRHICHTSKHAEGRSAKKLRTLRADIMDVTLTQDDRGFLKPRVVKQPLAGEDVYVSQHDLLMYCDAVKELWVEVWNTVKK